MKRGIVYSSYVAVVVVFCCLCYALGYVRGQIDATSDCIKIMEHARTSLEGVK